MKIGYFHHGIWPSASPASTFITYNALGFIENGTDFRMIAVRGRKGNAESVLADEFDVTVPSFPADLLNTGKFRKQHRVIYLLALYRLFKRRYDVLITRNLSFLPYAFLLRRLTGVKVIYESHDFYSDLALMDLPESRLNRKKRQQEFRYLPQVDGIISVSEELRRLYARHYPDTPGIGAVTGVKPVYRQSGRNGGNGVVAYVGSFNFAAYDFGLMLRGFVQAGVPDLKLLIAGARTAAERSRMERIVEESGAGSVVEIRDWQSAASMADILAGVDAGCAPLAAQGRSRICSPLKVLEYLAAGVPVIASRAAGVEDIIHDGEQGFLPGYDAAEWAGAFRSVPVGGVEYRRMSDACVEAAERLSWANRAARINEFLISLKG